MRNEDGERWLEDVDVDRVRASPHSIAGGWVVVGILAALMLIGPPAVNAVDVALVDAKQEVVKVEHRLAHALSIFDCGRSG